MAVTIAEYIGMNAAVATPYQPGQPIPNCPFMGIPCTKLKRSQPQRPVCSVFSDGTLWITCEQRLISAAQTVSTAHPYFSEKVLEVGRIIWGATVSTGDLAILRQHVIGTSNADFVFAYNPQWRVVPIPLRFVMEIQGGGPTNSTGEITRHVQDWETGDPTKLLTDRIGSSADVRGVWKRLLEQLFTKGLAATKLRQGVGCVLGEKLFDAIDAWIRWSQLKPPADKFIDFIVIPYGIASADTSPISLGPIQRKIIRTSFRAFLEQLQLVGIDADFSGTYTTLDGRRIEGT